MTAVILNRPRHEEIIDQVRRAGARIHLIGDGDVAAAISCAMPDTGVDILFGTGGAPEGVIAAAAATLYWRRNSRETSSKKSK